MESSISAAVPVSRPVRIRAEDRIEMTEELVDAYFRWMADKGRTPETLDTYRRNLDLFYAWLPEGKHIRRDTLQRWRESLLESGYAVRTVNTAVSSVNSLLGYCGRRDFQIEKPLALDGKTQPELTRAEYLRLLRAACLSGRERTSLFVKLLGNTALGLLALPLLTVAAVNDGVVHPAAGPPVRIPSVVAQQLLDYAAHEGIHSGPIFLTRDGNPISRTDVTTSIQYLCKTAQVPKAKANPRCLKKLYQSTRRAMEQELAPVLDRMYDQLLEQEQIYIAWEPCEK